MAEQVRSAKDVMQETAKSYTSGFEAVAEKVISRRPLCTVSQYSYCPYCVKRAKIKGEDYKRICKPLWAVTYQRLFKTGRNEKGQIVGRIFIEKEFQCPTCKDANNNPKVITVDDFEKIYISQVHHYEAKVDIPLTAEDIRKAGFDYYGM